jgi:hypothetical protein
MISSDVADHPVKILCWCVFRLYNLVVMISLPCFTAYCCMLKIQKDLGTGLLKYPEEKITLCFDNVMKCARNFKRTSCL